MSTASEWDLSPLPEQYLQKPNADPRIERAARITLRAWAVTVVLAKVAAVVLVLVAAVIVVSPKADAAEPWLQPYGGCKEAGPYSHTQGARDCRAHGWIVHDHFVITPADRLAWTDFEPCQYEDSSGCYWNARRMGNGQGMSFVVTTHGVVFYVR